MHPGGVADPNLVAAACAVFRVAPDEGKVSMADLLTGGLKGGLAAQLAPPPELDEYAQAKAEAKASTLLPVAGRSV